MYCFITSPLARSGVVTGTSDAPVNLLPALYAAATKIKPSEGGIIVSVTVAKCSQ